MMTAASATASGQGGQFIGVDDDPVMGDANARVTIIEFGDYQCPVCRLFWKETLPRIRKEYIDTGKVKLVFRDFPLPVHSMAVPAAMATECAEDQGRFWEFHDKVYREQDRRAREGEVAEDFATASGVGLQGTPVFFINGRALFGTHPFATFQKIIEEELRK